MTSEPRLGCWALMGALACIGFGVILILLNHTVRNGAWLGVPLIVFGVSLPVVVRFIPRGCEDQTMTVVRPAEKELFARQLKIILVAWVALITILVSLYARWVR